LVVLVRLSVPVQVTDWKDSCMTYNVLMGTSNPTHSLTRLRWVCWATVEEVHLQ